MSSRRRFSIVSRSQSDLNLETESVREEYRKILQLQSLTISDGPNSHQQIAFGGTSKLQETKQTLRNQLEEWKKYNEIGQTVPRKRIAQTFGKLLTPPGPGEYTPKDHILSTEEPSHQYTLHDRTFYTPVDRLDTPGPGTYDTHTGLRIEFERFRRDPLTETAPPKGQLYPSLSHFL
jgi:hypothetical protein